MTVLRIDNDDGSCRLEIPGANRRWSLILLRVPSFNGFSAYVTPQDGKLDENTPKTSVSDVSDLISVRDFIDETIAQHNQGPISAEEQTHFEIIECENHMPVAIRQFDSEEEAMEYLNMRLKSEHPSHPSERHEAQESEGTTAQGLHEFSEQLRIQSVLRMLEMNARGEFNAFERIELYAALNNQRTRKALGITVESSPRKQNRQRINTQ